MKRLAAIIVTTLGAASAFGSGGGDALQPLREGVPEVAVVRLREQLQAASEPAERQRLQAALATAFLAAGQPEEARLAARELEGEPRLRARIEAALGNWQEALAFYEATPDGGAAAVLERAECLRRLGRADEAIALLEKAPPAGAAAALTLAELYLDRGDAGKAAACLRSAEPAAGREEKWRDVLEARLFLVRDQPAFAYERFQALAQTPRELPPDLLVASVLGMSDALARLNGPTAADNVVEEFLWKNPESPHLGRLFRKLDEIYAGEENSSDSELQKWAQREPPRRAGYAAYYQARMAVRSGRADRALRALKGFAERFPQHPVLAEALLLQGEALAARGDFAAAQQALDAAMRAARSERQRAEIEMASATSHFKAGEFVLAATVFRAVGEREPAFWPRAVFNSALSWLHQGNYTRFLQDYRELSSRDPESPYRRELILEEGLLQARQGAPEAEATLRQFLRDFPENPRVPEARLALAEIRYREGDASGASRYLKVTNTGETSPNTAEQADYLALFVADSALDESKTISLCGRFLEKYPHSSHKAEVRMKLGQLYFRQADFAAAQAQFETLARENPQSELATPALFLAGQASMKSMSPGGIDRAIGLFEEVARVEGSLKGYARLQQALAQNQLGKPNEAILLYDAVLEGNPPQEVRHAALAGKAENLAELGAKDPAALEKALALYQQIAAEPEIAPVWRAQALYKKGGVLEAMKKPDEALAAYYEVLEAGVSRPEEYYWFYKAGFEAGRLCEARAEWKSAVGVYRKIAAQEGPRGGEAKARAEQLRLEHFLWE